MSVSGTVKSWNEFKGYGFISSVQYPDNIFVHRSGLAEGCEGLVAGDQVQFDVGAAPTGKPTAMNVSGGTGTRAGQVGPQGMNSGVVKSWNDERGYGFVEMTGTEESLFVHRNNLAGCEALRQGDNVTFDISYDKEKEKNRCENVQGGTGQKGGKGKGKGGFQQFGFGMPQAQPAWGGAGGWTGGGMAQAQPAWGAAAQPAWGAAGGYGAAAGYQAGGKGYSPY